MSSGEITLTQLRALIAVQRHGSITAAATALRVTQPVLTRGLRQLEQQLGVALLHRSARGASLTGYGEVLVARALRIDEEVRRAQDEIRQMQGKVFGRVTIACSPIPMMLFVPEAIGQLRQSFPGVELRVTEAVYPEVENEFRQNRLDFAVGPVPESGLGREYKTTKLLEVDLVVAVRRGHARSDARSLKEMQDEGWMVMGPRGGPGAIVEKVFGRYGLKAPSTPVYLETVWAALEVIKHSNIVGFMPSLLARWAADEISIVPVVEKIPPLKIHAITSSTAILTPAARALMSAIRASAAAKGKG